MTLTYEKLQSVYIPLAQIGVTVAVTAALKHFFAGRFYSVNTQTTVLLAAVAAIFASSVHHFTRKTAFLYGSIVGGLALGIAAHRFFYPLVPLKAVLNIQGVLIIGGVLLAVKGVADYLYTREQNKSGRISINISNSH